MKIYIIFILIGGGFLYSCGNRSQSKDVFYSKKRGLDYERIPLIRPYDLMRLNGSKEWGMNMKSFAPNFLFSNIKKAAVINDVIVLYANNTYISLKDNTIKKDGWMVIIPSKKIEIGFDRHDKYLKYLSENGVKEDPYLYDIELVYEEYNKNDTISWKPAK